MADNEPDKKPDPKEKNMGDRAKESMEKFSNKLGEKFDHLKSSDNMGNFRNFVTLHQRDVIVYVVLIIGFIISIYQPYLGHLIIGIIVGLYFAKELAYGLSGTHEIILKHGLFRVVILCFLGITLFISAPMIFIGIAIGAAIKLFAIPS